MKHEVEVNQREVRLPGGRYEQRTGWRMVAECSCGWNSKPQQSYERARIVGHSHKLFAPEEEGT